MDRAARLTANDDFGHFRSLRAGDIKPRKWQLAGFGVCAAVFFAFLYQDTGWLNRLEENAEELASKLAPGTRVIVMIEAPAASRMEFVDMPPSARALDTASATRTTNRRRGSFGARAGGSPVVASSADDAQDMASGQYK